MLGAAVAVVGMATPAQALDNDATRCRAGIDVDAVCTGVDLIRGGAIVSAEFLSFGRDDSICDYSATIRIKDETGAVLLHAYKAVTECGHGSVSVSAQTTIKPSGRDLRACMTHYIGGRRQQLGVCVPFPG